MWYFDDPFISFSDPSILWDGTVPSEEGVSLVNEPDHSYVGSGHILMKRFGVAEGWAPLGNCSALTFSPQTTDIVLQNFRNPGGGEQNRVPRLTGINMGLTFHDFKGENFARFTRGAATDEAGATVTAETVPTYKGFWVPLAKIANSITTVAPVGGGSAYTAGTDYVLENGGLTIPSGSTITDSVAGAPSCQVTYVTLAQTIVESFVMATQQYSLVFAGLNEAQSGKSVLVRAHKVSGSVLAELGLIGDQFGQGQVSGGLLPDTTQGANKSQYFTYRYVN